MLSSFRTNRRTPILKTSKINEREPDKKNTDSYISEKKRYSNFFEGNV